MKKLIGAALGLLLSVTVPTWAQSSIRNVTINAETDEGKLLQQAGDEKDPAKRVAQLEEFLTKYASNEAAGYVHYQLLTEYLKATNFDKAADHGTQTLAKVPDDLEVAYLTIQALEGKGDAPGLIALVEKTNVLAAKAASAPKPADAEQAESWKRDAAFAAQVKQFNEHALYATAVKAATPQAKIQLLDALRKNYPGGQFDKSLDPIYFYAYQQVGDDAKMLAAAEAALANDPTNETYLYRIAESNTDPAKGKLDDVQKDAQKILDTLPAKPKPEGVADDAWNTQKNTYLGLAHSLMGRSLANQGKCPAAVKELQAASSALKGNDPVLAPVYFFLGFCSARMERPKDAVTYFGLASKIPGPYQAPAADMLAKIRAAISGR
jgi:hypothetical protein